MKKFGVLLGLCLIAAVPAGRAHYLWLETPPEAAGAMRIYYGEYEEGKRERSGGRLDEVSVIEMLAPSAGTLEKKDLFFETQAEAAVREGWIQIHELGRPVKDWSKYDIGIVKPNYYAGALPPGAGEPLPEIPVQKTALGIYPTQLGEQTRVLVYFQGKPLPKAKVLVHAPNLWTKEWRSDESGEAVVHLPWPGLYVLEVIHLEKTPGEYEGVAYEAVRHRATFTFQKD